MRSLPPYAFRRRVGHALAGSSLVLALLAVGLRARAATAPAGRRTVPVIMLSDIHFDPFSQPSKLARLRSEPIEQWAAILDAPPAESDSADFVALQRTCRVRGTDSDWTLMHASLTAAHAQQPAPLFVTVSGDLMAHGFDCKFHQLAASTTADDYSAFAAKTVAFVASSLHGTFPGVPVYIGLGNNDSGCADYHESPGSDYLKAAAHSIAADLPEADRAAVEDSAQRVGDYVVRLPRPMQNTRLIVLQDIFESRRYSACSAGENTSAAEQQIAWLKGQLADARDHNQAVWVMAHIPPGVDVYSTLTKGTDVCTGKAPDLFLSSDALTQTLVEFPWTVHLVLLAHSHMDEMRLFHSGDLSGANGRHSSHIPGAVPGKLVPSISPINGNSPAFTVAQVDPHSATLVDYAVYVASNTTGLDAHWPEEYRYSTTYHEPDFSAASVSRLVLTMRDDKTAADPATGSYAHWFWAGDSGVHALALRLVWPAYSCAMTETTEAGYRSCVCPAGSSSPAKGPAAKEPVTAPSPTPQDAGKPTPQR